MRAAILGSGHYLPDHVVSNADLAEVMPTSDDWIQQRTGIKERRHVNFETDPMGSSEMGARSSQTR